MIVEFSSVQVSLGAKQILKSINFEVLRGEFIGLVGPNGAGKSTLLKAACGLLPLENGTIRISDKKIDDMSRKELASHIAYLPQERDIEWPMPVGTVVGLGRQSLLGLGRALTDADYQNISQAMQALEIEHLQNRRANELSGGEKACVLMARALAQNPEVLLADEPVSGLDPAHSLSLMAHLKMLAGKGMTVIVVMHDLTLAGQFCDRLICLDRGEVACVGSPKKVLSAANLKKVYGVKAVRAEYKNKTLFVPVEKV